MSADLRIDERIAERYGALSPQERRAADVLLAHLDDLAIYRAAELADLAGVSKATMSRLFRHLGFDDFGEVREHLRGLRGRGVPVTLSGAPSLVAHLEHEIANLQAAMARLDETHLDTAAGLLAEAGRVVVLGWRNSYPVALHLRQQLSQARPGVTVAPQPAQSVSEELLGLGAGDAVVVVGFRRRPDNLRDLLGLLEESGTPVVLVADPTARSLATRAAVWLQCPLTTASAFDSYAAAMSVVAVLADRVLDRVGARGEERVTAIDAAYRAAREIEAV
ncbi:MurR/RpiR family transcriptional regulator [Aeromicrobium wangtongii]|uniref:MurR/RpiR family transcriptional regulator n=1 Tax=Aeromicrobium wangtongii TaxID=2969247 RepID=A0ABY5MEV0_9ACTN|nr:MurR/RpiR family transcriptional regulator [Aeromicrobium wangtongii]MCD9196842.1 MurR/RpiR family transcriptional regulator [Aeromicrobium wangtongii]UUP14351.1 MurR/RpiR family transcriptional regulator [Aeromicrobium wangtongii]